MASYPFDDMEMTDEEYADLIQAACEQPTEGELESMFAWWEVQGI